MYTHYISQGNEVLIFMDAEIYQRDHFYSLFSNYLKSIANFEGKLIFDGSFSESLMGDYRPRTTLFIFKWASSDLFYRWWNSSQNYRYKQDFMEFSDLKVTLVTQNEKNNRNLMLE